MFRSSFWQRLATIVTCVLLIITSLPLATRPETAFAQQETISINPTQGPPGTTVTVTGTGWNEHGSRGLDVPIQISASGYPPTQVADPVPDTNGNFTASFAVPANVPTGQLTISAIIGNGGSAQAWFTVSTNTPSGPTVTMQRVWTADAKNNGKTSFAPGDVIHYIAQVTNSGSSTITAMFTFLATGPQQIFSWSGPGPVAAGTVSFYSPSTVPANAPAGTYTISVTVTYNGQSSTNAGQFSVIGSPTPTPTPTPTPIPTLTPTPTPSPTITPTSTPTAIPTLPVTLSPTPTTVPTGQPFIKLSESRGAAPLAPGLFGTGFPPKTQITMQWFPPRSSTGQILTTAPPSVIADEHGNFSTVIQIPQNSPLGQGMVCAVDAQIRACTDFTVEPAPAPLPPEINSRDVGCEGLLFAGELLGWLELAIGVGEMGCAIFGSGKEFQQ